MGNQIKAAAIAATLGSFAGGDRRCRARARGSVSGRCWAAAAGLAALLGGKAVERSP